MVYFRDWKKIRVAFGEFEHLNRAERKKYTLIFEGDARNVCGVLIPEIIKIVTDLNLQPNRILLDGDNKSVSEQVKNKFGFKKAQILTAGMEGNYDYNWNFENDPPAEICRNVDLIISQAMFEHLIDPFKHFKDLASLLSPGGYLIIHSHLPGFVYHRYPIDAVRFFPDWFELSAKKIGLKVKRKFFRDFHLIYLFEK